MEKVYAVADFLISAMKLKGVSLTNLHLNKMLYFAQGYSLVQNGEPLFDEEIQAWQYGPVVPSVYEKYKQYGKNPINQINEIDFNSFKTSEIETLSDVIADLGDFSASRLVDISHSENSPWYNVYYKNKKGEITKQMMKDYFSKRHIKTFEERTSHIPVVDKLPKDWYDPAEDGVWQ